MVGDTKTSMVRSDHIGWLLCDGRELSQAEYRALYAVLGDDFGPAVAAGNFKLPDSRGHVMGLINQPNEYTATPRTDVSGWRDGDVSGEQTHTLIIAEMPNHQHGPTDVSGNTDGNGFTGVSGEHDHTSNATGNNAEPGLIYQSNGGTANTTAGSITVGLTDYSLLDATAGEPDIITSPAPLTINRAGNHAHTIGSTGGSQPHNNMQPTLFLGNLFIYGGRVNHNIAGFDGATSLVNPPARPSYFPSRNASRLH
jgi:microcystin-dependent protein